MMFRNVLGEENGRLSNLVKTDYLGNYRANGRVFNLGDAQFHWTYLTRIIHATRKTDDTVSIEA